MLTLLVFITAFTLAGFFLLMHFIYVNPGQPGPGVFAGFTCVGIAFLLTLAMISLVI